MIFSMALLEWLMRLIVRGSVMTKDWVHGVCHSPVCQILLQIVVRAVITSSCLLGPILLGCCQFQLTPLSSIIVLQLLLLCEGWGGCPLGTVQY